MNRHERQDGNSSTSKRNDSPAPMPEKLWHDLIDFENLPRWLQDNHYIRTGYRQPSYSYSRSFQSMLHWHNESVNIWTHFLPGVLSLPFGFYLIQHVLIPRYQRASTGDVRAMSCFFFGATIGMGMSGIYHTLSNHSPTVARFWNQMDYAGIAFMIWGSFVPSVYYGFWCHPELQKVYWSMITIIGIACICATLTPKFRTPAWRPLRAGMFIGMGLSALLPVIHGLRLFGLQKVDEQMGLRWTVLQGVLYITGAVLYALRFPESSHPGSYDVVGASHQIFHVCVVLAAFSQLAALLKAFDHRHGFPGAVCALST